MKARHFKILRHIDSELLRDNATAESLGDGGEEGALEVSIAVFLTDRVDNRRAKTLLAMSPAKAREVLEARAAEHVPRIDDRRRHKLFGDVAEAIGRRNAIKETLDEMAEAFA